jgi:hypothetical protein
MSDVIAFLESMGRASAPLSDADQLQATASFAPDARAAIAERDSARLGRILGGRPFMACSVIMPNSDEPLPEEQPATPDDVPGEDEVRAA